MKSVPYTYTCLYTFCLLITFERMDNIFKYKIDYGKLENFVNTEKCGGVRRGP